MRRVYLSILFLLGLGTCSPTASNPFEAARTYFTTMSALHVEVAYEVGAEPATGNSFGQPLWHFLKTNLEALFSGRAIVPAVHVPTALAQMSVLPTQGKSTWSAPEILHLAKANRKGISTSTEGYFFVAFLNGYFDKGNGAETQVLGVQLNDSSVIAIFKPVVAAASSGQPAYVGKYIEQSTLVHEMGHALGLVNNGLPVVSAHHDHANGAHCSNTACTMYWQNEGGAAARQFVIKYVLTGNEVIFGSECLRDAREFK